MSTPASDSPPARPYLRWALALLGAALLLALSTIQSIENPPAAPVAERQELTLGGITTVEQTFSTTRPGLIGLEIGLRASGPADADLLLPVRLRYADGVPVDIVSLSAPVSAAQDGLLSLRFAGPIIPRDPYAVTETLRLILVVPQLPPGTGPQIVTRQSADGQGRLQIDGMPVPDLDLLLVPLYQSRWIDRFWPTSALAAGKPGLLGWPPLYALLPYLYLVALIEAAVALHRARAA